jgi:hypothetical protein
MFFYAKNYSVSSSNILTNIKSILYIYNYIHSLIMSLTNIEMSKFRSIC